MNILMNATLIIVGLYVCIILVLTAHGFHPFRVNRGTRLHCRASSAPLTQRRRP